MRRSSSHLAAWFKNLSPPQWRPQEAPLRCHRWSTPLAACASSHRRAAHTISPSRGYSTLRDSILEHDPTFAFDASPSDGFGDISHPPAQEKSPLSTMRNARIMRLCRNAGLKGNRGLVDAILAHFEDPSASTQSAASTSSLCSLRVGSMRALLRGSLTKEAKEITISPAQFLRVYQGLREDSSSVGEPGHIFAFLGPFMARRLALQLGKSRHAYLFEAFQDLQIQLLGEPSFVDFPTRQELSGIFGYAFQAALWERGGYRLVKLHLDRLSSQDSIRPILLEAGNDARAWLGPSADSHTMFNLFSILFALRLSIQEGDVNAVWRYCGTIVERFAALSHSLAAPCQFLISSAEVLCHISPARELGSEPNGFILSQTLLKDHSVHVESALKNSLSTSDTCPFGTLCDMMLPKGLFRSFADLLFHYQKLGFDPAYLVTPVQLIRLIRGLVLQGGQTSVHRVAQLVLARDNRRIEAKLLGVDFPAKRFLLNSLITVRLKHDVAWLWKHWTRSADPDSVALKRDISSVLGIVGLFTRTVPLETQKMPPRSNSRMLRHNQEAEGDWKFASQVLQTFLDAKIGLSYSHFELTSLAVARAHLQQEQKALNTYAQLLHQREIPDQTDIIVLLEFIGKRSPRMAARIYLSYLLYGDGGDPATSPNTFQGVRPSAVVFETLIRMAFSEKDFKLVETLLTQAQERLSGRYLGDVVTLLVRAFDIGSMQSVWSWPKVVDEITPGIAGKLNSSIWSTLTSAAASGLSLSGMHARQKDTTDSASNSFVAPILQDGDLIAAIRLMSLTTSHYVLKRHVVQTVLDRIYSKALMVARQRRGPLRSESLRFWIEELDKVVASLRQSHDTWERNDRVEQTRRDLLAEGESKDISGDQELTTSGDGLQSPSSRTSKIRRSGGRFLDVVAFRKIINIYLSLGDISGASQAHLWMRIWDPKATVGSRTSRRLQGILGSVDMLDRDRQSPSWTFEGRTIEKTKSWWKIEAGFAEEED